jgi:hypothetical protein
MFFSVFVEPDLNPNPDPDSMGSLDPGPPGSVSERPRSGFFHHQAKKVRKTLFPMFYDFFLAFYL